MSAEDLESEVTAFQNRETEQQALSAERAERRRQRPLTMENVTNIAAVMPEMLAMLERAAISCADYRESLRTPFADLRPKPCKRHPLSLRLPAFEETVARSRVAGEFRPAYAPCGVCEDSATREAYRAFWRRRGVEERNIDSTLDNFFPLGDPLKAAALARVCGWQARDGLFLLLYGTPGTGKGHLATGCLKAIGGGIFVNQTAMLRELRDSYGTKTTTALLDGWKTAEMLALDEFGRSGGGKDEEPMLFEVLAARYDKGLPTIIASNLDLEKIRAALGAALLDRIGSDCEPVKMVWDSHRKPKA